MLREGVSPVSFVLKIYALKSPFNFFLNEPFFKSVFRGPVILVTIFRARKLRAQNTNQHANSQGRSISIEGGR